MIDNFEKDINVPSKRPPYEIALMHDHILRLEEELQAKEQECEELAYENYELNELFDRLKAENDELKKKCNIYTCGICGNKEDCNKLYKTLTEIKEVLQFYNNSTIGTDKGNGIFEFEVSNDNVLDGKLICCYDTNPAKKALQKISEVENG